MSRNMEARLVAIAGPLEGAAYAVEGELTIGREKSNRITVDDRVLSRRHCVIRGQEGKYELQDLNSSNGTYVNGLPVSTQGLKSGDQIKAGESLFVLLEGAEEAELRSLPLELAAE